MKTNRGRGGVKSISMLTLWKKLPDFSNSGSCWKFYQNGIDILLNFFYIWTCKYFYCCYYIYMCKKHCHLLCWVYKINNSFLSFHSTIFHSEKFISILHVKWAGMNKEEQVENLKFSVNILFEWLQSLF